MQADIEAINSMGCHPMAITTTLTVQNSQGVANYSACDADYLRAQSQVLISDMPIGAIKTGMLATTAIVNVVKDFVTTQTNTALVVDPVMSSNNGEALSQVGYAQTLSNHLLPLATIVTPNLPELYQLAPNADNIVSACQHISSLGCKYVLVTGTHDKTSEVINRLFKNGELIDEQSWPRLPGEYHGSGCTLASSLAALLSKKVNIIDAAQKAQDYTWHSLKYGQTLGKGQKHPNRFFWVKDNWPDN